MPTMVSAAGKEETMLLRPWTMVSVILPWSITTLMVRATHITSAPWRMSLQPSTKRRQVRLAVRPLMTPAPTAISRKMPVISGTSQPKRMVPPMFTPNSRTMYTAASFFRLSRGSRRCTEMFFFRSRSAW